MDDSMESSVEPAAENSDVAEGMPIKTSRRRRRMPVKAFGFTLAAALILLLGSGGYLAWSYQNHAEIVDHATVVKAVFDAEVEADAVIAAQAKAVAAAAAAAARVAKAAADEAATMALAGYSPAGDGMYYRFAEDSEFSCGYYDCTAVVVSTASTTCSGVYLEANLIRNDVVVGFVNDTAGSLGKYSVAVMTLEDYQDTGGAFRITKVNCY